MLKRKARIVGTSIVITIPSDFVKGWNIEDGDWMEIIPVGIGEFRIKTVKEE